MSKKKQFEIYEKAPIILAIIQFRYAKKEKLDIKKLKEIGKSIKIKFPEVEERILKNIRFEDVTKIGETKVLIDSGQIEGLRFVSADKSRTLIIGLDNFTVEIIGQYPGWDSCKEEVNELWELFKPALKEIELTGLSMRYVNKIKLPLDLEDISKYFTTYIQSTTGTHPLNQFQLRYSSSDDATVMHVAHALEAPIEDYYPYLFDIDVIHNKPVEMNPKEIWHIFGALRERKNFIFNDGITEETKKIIR